MDNLRFLAMNTEHVDRVYRIEEESFFTPWSKQSIRSEINNPIGRYVVLCDGAEVVAYGGFWIVPPEANINNIAVAPEHRGKHLSKMLMNHLMEMGRNEGAKEMYLEVRSSNYVAQNLYRSLGFKMIGLRKGYYVDTDEDAIVMRCEL